MSFSSIDLGGQRFDNAKEKILWGLIYVLLTTFISLFLITAIQFLLFPYEIDWYEGVMLDHAARVYSGLSLFSKPSHEFVSAIYPPLYSFCAAFMMKLMGVTYLAGRIVSVFATCLAIGSLISILWRETSSALIALMGCALYVATVQLTGYAHLIARTDALLVGLLAITTTVSIRLPNRIGAIVSACMLALAFLTKQQSLLYAPAFIIWFGAKDRLAGIVFLLTLTLACSLAFFIFQTTTNSWYSYYVFQVPSFKATFFGWWRTLTVFPIYVFSKFGIGSFVILIGSMTVLRSKKLISSTLGLLVLLFSTAIIQTAFHLGDQMSSSNTVLPLSFFFALAFPALYARLRSEELWKPILPWALAMQLLALLYNPFSEPLGWIRSEHDRSGARFATELASISGEVFMPAHTFIARQMGKGSFANVQTTRDISYMGDTVASELNKELDSQLAVHRYGAIILDKNPFFTPDSLKGYYFARTINNDVVPFGSRFGAVLTIPRYLYLPRPGH